MQEHDEIDIELLTNLLQRGRHPQVQLTRYAREPLGAGNGGPIDLPSGFDPLAEHEWTIRWSLTEIEFRVDGVFLSSSTTHVPQGPMAANVIAWGPAADWPAAFSPLLQPVSSSSQSQSFVVLLRSVAVATSGTPTQVSTAIPHFASGDVWTTGVFVMNTSKNPGTYSSAFRGENGSPAVLPFAGGSSSTIAGAILGQGSAFYEAGDLRGALATGSAEVTTDPGIVVQALFRRDVAGIHYEAAVPAMAGVKDVVFPFDATVLSGTAVPLYTGFAIANLDSVAASITCAARNPGGAAIPNTLPVVSVPALGHWAGYLFLQLSGQRGTIECSANANIALTALRFIGDSAFSSLPVVSLPHVSTAPLRALPHFAVGDVWTTGITIMNPVADPGTFSIAFLDQDGHPAMLPFPGGSTSTLSGDVAGQGSAFGEASDPLAQVASGSAQITAGPDIVVQALFRRNAGGTLLRSRGARSGRRQGRRFSV
jgi:hypothetical protein